MPLLLIDLPARSQQSAPITLDVNAVNLLATVRDKHGDIIRNLTKDDFTLEQDGKPQTITYFAKESNLPLTLGVLVDTSMSQRRVLLSVADYSDTLRASEKHPRREGCHSEPVAAGEESAISCAQAKADPSLRSG